MNYEIVNLNQKVVVGLVKETTNIDERSVKDIGSECFCPEGKVNV